MNRKDLAEQLSDYITTSVGENDTDDLDLGEAAAEITGFIESLEEDEESEDADESEESESSEEKA